MVTTPPTWTSRALLPGVTGASSGCQPEASPDAHDEADDGCRSDTREDTTDGLFEATIESSRGHRGACLEPTSEA